MAKVRSSLRSFIGTAAILWLAIFVSGCAHPRPVPYKEPSVRSDDAAFVEARVPVWIVSIDGEKVNYGFGKTSQRKKITSGPHSVRISYHGTDWQTVSVAGAPETARRQFHSLSEPEVKFTARPGYTYVLSAAEVAVGKWRPGIDEIPTWDPADSEK